MKTIFRRRSIRSYQNQAVEDEKLQQIIKAAMQAPSAGNQQPWEFIVVKDKDSLQKLSEMSPYSKMIAQAPAAIVVLGNTTFMKYPAYWEQDLGACTQNILLEACDLGLGTVWLGVTPVEERMLYIKELFNLTDEKLPFAVVPVGYPAEEKEFVDRYDEARVTFVN